MPRNYNCSSVWYLIIFQSSVFAMYKLFFPAFHSENHNIQSNMLFIVCYLFLYYKNIILFKYVFIFCKFDHETLHCWLCKSDSCKVEHLLFCLLVSSLCHRCSYSGVFFHTLHHVLFASFLVILTCTHHCSQLFMCTFCWLI